MVTIAGEKELFMNDTNLTQKENVISLQPSKNKVAATELPSSVEGETDLDNSAYEREIDLNELFPEVKIDLNDLFPDAQLKQLLKSIIKNKKEMSTIKERLATENQTSGEKKND